MKKMSDKTVSNGLYEIARKLKLLGYDENVQQHFLQSGLSMNAAYKYYVYLSCCAKAGQNTDIAFQEYLKWKDYYDMCLLHIWHIGDPLLGRTEEKSQILDFLKEQGVEKKDIYSDTPYYEQIRAFSMMCCIINDKDIQRNLANILLDKNPEEYKYNNIWKFFYEMQISCCKKVKERDYDIRYYQFLMEDLNQNGQASFVWKYYQKIGLMPILWDQRSLRFFSNWCRYFKSPEQLLQYIDVDKSKENHFMELNTKPAVSAFLEQNPFHYGFDAIKDAQYVMEQDDNVREGVGFYAFSRYEFRYLWYDKALMDRMIIATEGRDFSISSQSYCMTGSIDRGSATINLLLYNAKSTKYTDERGIETVDIKNRLDLFLPPGNKAYVSIGTGGNNTRYVPLTVKKLVPFLKNEDIKNYFIAAGEDSGNLFFKDVIMDFCEPVDFLCPITVEQAFKYHNKKEYIYDVYPQAKKLRIDWNKVNINLAYAIVKSLKFVDERDYGILSNVRDLDMIRFEEDMCNNYGTTKWMTECTLMFLSNVYWKRVSRGATGIKNRDISKIEVKDCFIMLRQRHLKIHLSYGLIRIARLHDELSQGKSIYNTSEIRVPKESVFNPLRKKLPKEFEWIKNRKRLFKEAEIMHNCVWIYGDNINNDDCAIYSYFDESGEMDPDGTGKRYTIEFGYDEKSQKYRIRQLETAYNKGGSKLLRERIEKLIN